MTDKIRELAEKLLELAKRGVGGEKENAAAALKRHLAKHNLTIEEIEGDEMIELELPWYEPDIDFQNRLQHQILSNVIGMKRNREAKVYQVVVGKKTSYLVNRVMVTRAEEVEIRAKLEFYYREYIEQEKYFFVAFIQKNHLYHNENDGSVAEGKMSLDKIRKVFGHMDSIEHKPFHKQIKESDN